MKVNTPAVQRYFRLCTLLDLAFRVPGTRWRFGLDPILGLVPGLGDAIGALLGTYGIWVARQARAPNIVQLRMLQNLVADALIGAIPLFGDIFDLLFKAHARNRDILEQWLIAPQQVEKTSKFAVYGLLLCLLTIVAGCIALVVFTIRWIAAQ
jgi:hypothetical protein